MLISCFLLAVFLFLYSCKKNKLNGIWLHKNKNELTWLKINHHQYLIKKEISPHLEMLMHKEGKIVYRDDSIQFVPAKVFDLKEQKWLLDYDKFRPIYHVLLSGDSLILSNAKDTLIYLRKTRK
jgi:hypothetical protein